jgi:hypothetical protein
MIQLTGGLFSICLHCFEAPDQFVSWVKACLTSPSFSISLNGSLVGFFQGKKGIILGDPISPYLFVLAMEVLSLLLEEAASGSSGFIFHPKCSAIKLTHLCFADDLLILSAAHLRSIKAIKEVLREFEDLSRLKANPSKRCWFKLCGEAEFIGFASNAGGISPSQVLGGSFDHKTFVNYRL